MPYAGELLIDNVRLQEAFEIYDANLPLQFAYEIVPRTIEGELTLETAQGSDYPYWVFVGTPLMEANPNSDASIAWANGDVAEENGPICILDGTSVPGHIIANDTSIFSYKVTVDARGGFSSTSCYRYTFEAVDTEDAATTVTMASGDVGTHWGWPGVAFGNVLITETDPTLTDPHQYLGEVLMSDQGMVHFRSYELDEYNSPKYYGMVNPTNVVVNYTYTPQTPVPVWHVREDSDKLRIWNDIIDKPKFADVAFTGNFSDLSGIQPNVINCTQEEYYLIPVKDPQAIYIINANI